MIPPKRKTTYRVASKSYAYCKFLAKGIHSLGKGAWIYKEGSGRNVWIVEFSKSLLNGATIQTKQDKIDYIRGYFDIEGGISRIPTVRYYLYFAQKNYTDLMQVRNYLLELGISCGAIHNPSKKVDPNYWRFFVRASSYEDFFKIVNTDHPEEQMFLRMKI